MIVAVRIVAWLAFIVGEFAIVAVLGWNDFQTVALLLLWAGFVGLIEGAVTEYLDTE